MDIATERGTRYGAKLPRHRSSDNGGDVKTDTIGRIPTISLSPHQSELFHLRILPLKVAGASGFEELRTVDGTVCPTFQEACLRRGLISDDREIHRSMEEASSIRFGDSLREFFYHLDILSAT